MKYFLRFLLVLALGLAVLWAALGKESIFPAKEKSGAELPIQGPHVPAIRVDQGSGAVSMAPRGKLDIRSSRARKLPGGGIVQILRYRLQSRNAQPNPDGTYTLHKARLTIYRASRPPLPAAVLDAARMTISMVTGREGIRPMENQEMVLEKVTLRTGRAFQGAELTLRTEKLLVRTAPGETTFRTPTTTTPYTLKGKIGGGDLDMAGLGLEGTLPPADDGRNREKAPGKTGSFQLLGRSANRGTWSRGGTGDTVRFSCAGPFRLGRGGETQVFTASLHEKVRVERGEGPERTSLSASSLEAELLPEKGTGEGKASAKARRILAVGGPVELSSPRGRFRARRMEAFFRRDGSFLSLKAEGKPSVTEKRPDGNSFSASCPGPLTFVSLEGSAVPLGPFLSFPGVRAGLPGSLVTLSGPSRISLSTGKGPGVLKSASGLRILLSRGREILSLAGFGTTSLEAPGLEGTSSAGLTLVQAPFFSFSGKSRLEFLPPGSRCPSGFTVRFRGDRKEKESPQAFTLEGRGFLARETLPGGRSTLSARAAGPGGFLSARGSTARGDFMLEKAGTIEISRTEKGETALRARRDPPRQLLVSFPSRGITAWACSLDGKGKETLLAGRPGLPVLLSAPLEEKEGGKTRMRLLAGEARLGEGKTLLHARKGVKIRFQGNSILPGAEGGDTELSAGEMYLFRGGGEEKPSTALLSGKVSILVTRKTGTTKGRGRDLWISLEEKRAVLSGSPARIRVHAQGKRSLTVLSEIIRLSREETVAGDLASGIGGKIVLESGEGLFGESGSGGGRIEAVCGMPIHLKGDFLVFPGASIIQWFQGGRTPPGETPTLVCGSMVAKRGPAGGEPFLWIRGKNGVKFQKGEFQGTGESLYFRPGPGILQVEGGKDPCRLALGEQAFLGRRITLNLHDFTWKVEGSSSVKRPLPASVGMNEGGVR